MSEIATVEPGRYTNGQTLLHVIEPHEDGLLRDIWWAESRTEGYPTMTREFLVTAHSLTACGYRREEASDG